MNNSSLCDLYSLSAIVMVVTKIELAAVGLWA
jgi:hypothetical protein